MSSAVETADFAEAKEPVALSDELDRLYRVLAPDVSGHGTEGPALRSEQSCAALDRVQTLFGLSSFERDLLLSCAGAALENRFALAFAALHKDPRATWPTFGLALQVLENPHWSALSRARPLRYWRLIEVDTGAPLDAPLRIDERILYFLIGVPAIDERLEGLIRPVAPTVSYRDTKWIEGALELWKYPAREKVLLIARDHSACEVGFAEICRQIGLQPWSMDASDIPASPVERDHLARLWTREAALTDAALSIRTGDVENLRSLTAWTDIVQGPLFIEVQPGSPAEQLRGLRLHLRTPSHSERKRIWVEQLGALAGQMNGQLERIIEHFHFDEPDIRIAAAAVRDSDNPAAAAWRFCRGHARRSLENLAQRIDARAGWDDLVLPAQQIESLRQIAIHVRQRPTVNDRWGFAERYSRGLGLSALFSGASGTGKTMAAEILAAELELDLYRIDLASVVSKYIGETEKNLRKVFEAAEESGAILLFDEADSLFGKRSEVRDSHDRYANLEISYLLQRMESYRGVAILTTNMQHVMDPAFLRRIRFIVQFPFPDAEARARIWERIFPAATPLGRLDFSQLSRLNVSGGIIRNIATHAAFLAAEEGGAVEMWHVLSAARIEYGKIDKPLTASETRGWL